MNKSALSFPVSLLLLAAVVLPLIASLLLADRLLAGGIASLGRHATQLAFEGGKDQHVTKMKQLVRMAQNQLEVIAGLPNLSDDARQRLARNALRKLHAKDAGEDFYIYVYQSKDISSPKGPKAGWCWVHPLNPKTDDPEQRGALEDANQIDMLDADKRPVIRELIDVAINRRNGGLHQYMWPQPSKGNRPEAKLGYVEEFPKWNWMVGTGMYLNQLDPAANSLIGPVNQALKDIRGQLLELGLVLGLGATMSAFAVRLVLIRACR